MSWLELDDGILDHPKFIRAVKLAGGDAVFLWLGIRAHCGQHLTDGFVPADMLPEVRGPRDSRRRKLALSALLTVGLVAEVPGGLQMHNYLKWSRSREDVLLSRKKNAERQAKSRGSHAVTSSVTTRAVTPSVTTPSSSPLPLPLPEERSDHVELELDISIPDLESFSPEPRKPKEPKQPPPHQAEAVRVFEAWKANTGHTGAVMDPKRLNRLKARLREGHSEDVLLSVLRNWRNDPWLAGSSGKTYDGIETLFRDAEQVERLAALVAPVKAPATVSRFAPPVSPNVDYETKQRLVAARRYAEFVGGAK